MVYRSISGSRSNLQVTSVDLSRLSLGTLLIPGSHTTSDGRRGVPGRDSHESVPVIAKVATTEGRIAFLHREARLYDGALESLQDKFVPKFWVLYSNESEHEGGPIYVVLLLSDCGTAFASWKELWDENAKCR